jgi:hypothetical protein
VFKKVPLVIYVEGERRIIGEATVSIENGALAMVGEINEDHIPDILRTSDTDFSIAVERDK